MRPLDGVTRERLENQVLSQTLANADVAAQPLPRQEAELAEAEAAALRKSLEPQLANVSDRTAETKAAAERLRRRETELAEAVEARHNLERRFSAALTLLQSQDADIEAKTERLTRREKELAEATETRLALERRLAEAESARHEAVRRSADDRSTATQQAAQRQSEFESVLRDEAARYETLRQDLLATRQKLAHANTTLQEGVDRHASAMTAAAAQRSEQLARYEARMAEAAAARDAVSRQLHEATVALDRARQDHVVNATVAAEREAEFVARLDQEAANREAVEQALAGARNKVAETETAIRNAEQRHVSDMTTLTAWSADQQAQYETRLAEAAAARDLVDQRLREVEVSLERTRQEAAVDAAAAAEHLARLEAQRVEGLANLQMLEGQLAAANTALHGAEQRVATERLAAERQAARRQAEFEAEVAREIAGRHTVEQDLATSQQKLAESESARREAEQRHASAMTSAAAQSAERHTELKTRLTHVSSAHAALERTLADTQKQYSSEMAANASLFAERQNQYETRLTQAATAHTELERALVDAQQRHASETRRAAVAFAERQREFETLLAQTTAVKEANDLRLREAEATLERIRDERAAESTAAAERYIQLESEFAKARAHGETLERRLTAATGALHTAEQLAVSERAAAAQQAAERQMEFEAGLSLELRARNTVELALTATREDLLLAEAALRDALQQHAAEMRSAATELSEQHSQYTTRLAQTSAAHAMLEQKLATAEQQHASAMKAAATQLAEQQRKYETHLTEVTKAREIVDQRLRNAEATLVRIRQESDSNAIASAERLSQRESELAEASATRRLLEGRLVDAENALKNAEDRALAERTATIQQSAQRRAEFDAQLAREVGARDAVERDLAETRSAAEQTRHALLGESAAVTERMRELEACLTRERADHAGKLADVQAQLRVLNAERDALHKSLAATQKQLEDLSRVHEDTNESFERVRQAKEIELERVTGEHAAELVRVNALVAERDGQMRDQAARHAASQQALARLENELRAAITAHRQQVEQLQSGFKALTQEFDATRRHRDKLQIEADRVPQLTGQLEAIRAESRRQFDGSPHGILRCSAAGALQEANRALITALGYRNVDELRALDSAASVFESPDDIRWLIERCERTPSESVDCTWKKKDGSRLIVRLRAVRIATDVVDIVAEDLTSLRAVEERLRQAQRMEAVGRLASEVAVTCDNLLRDVSQDGQRWLATVDSNTAQRHRGELIFGEVTRAASFLRQLSVYGEKQTNALAWVDVNNVLRDLAPVLKRVAGDDIELVLPKKGSALNVDVEAERVERVLVNIAAYGRTRMRSGGQLIVELARVAVDRDFVTKYPNVRQGVHALISVTEVRAAARADWPVGVREAVEATGAASERPGVDLGALQALIGDCGGHLWMKAEPGGDMEVKIHLPLRPEDTSTSAGVVRSARKRSVSRWFQS